MYLQAENCRAGSDRSALARHGVIDAEGAAFGLMTRPQSKEPCR